MTFVCRTQPYNPKIVGTQQVILYAMSFFTTIACRLPVFIQRALNRSLGSVQQDFFASLKDVYQTFGVTVGLFTKRFQCTTENLRKKVNPPVGLGLGHLKLNGMEFLKGIGLQIYQYEEHFVLNQRQHTGLPVVRYTLTHFAFQSEMAVIFIPMVLESY